MHFDNLRVFFRDFGLYHAAAIELSRSIVQGWFLEFIADKMARALGVVPDGILSLLQKYKRNSLIRNFTAYHYCLVTKNESTLTYILVVHI